MEMFHELIGKDDVDRICCKRKRDPVDRAKEPVIRRSDRRIHEFVLNIDPNRLACFDCNRQAKSTVAASQFHECAAPPKIRSDMSDLAGDVQICRIAAIRPLGMILENRVKLVVDLTIYTRPFVRRGGTESIGEPPFQEIMGE
jgi:hypothetical protein